MAEYSYSFNEENFYGPFESREAALAEAMSELTCQDHFDPEQAEHFVYTGMDEPHTPTLPGVEWLVENLQEMAYDAIGEAAEDWLEDVTNEEEEDLQDMVMEAVNKWLEKHKKQPTFFTVTEVETHTVKTSDLEGL